MYEADLTENHGPNPVHEAAYAQILRVLRDNKPFVDALLSMPKDKPIQNWKLALARNSKGLTTLRDLWQRDGDFRIYLRRMLSVHFHGEVEDLVRIFIL